MSIKNEKWYMSRRVWGSVLSFAATIIIVITPEHYDAVIAVATGIASALGIASWTAPKNEF